MYKKDVVPKLQEQLGFTNVYRVPKLDKIVLNTCLKEALQNIKILDAAVEDFGAITGQRSVITKAKKAISNFKLRAGVPLGCCVTLRRTRMYEFFDRLVNVSLPRVRDFKGMSVKAFDGLGNYTFGIKEQVIFPEIDVNKVEYVYGLNITINTTGKNNEEAFALLSLLGMPFRKDQRR
jgi:large subunit ribosomal protein L5